MNDEEVRLRECALRTDLLEMHRHTGDERYLELASKLRAFGLHERLRQPCRGRGRPRVYKDDDPRLLEMAKLLKRGDARNAHHAAGIVAARRPGHSMASTQIALGRIYRKIHRSKRRALNPIVVLLLNLEEMEAARRIMARDLCGTSDLIEIQRQIEGSQVARQLQRGFQRHDDERWLVPSPSPWTKIRAN